MIENLRQPMYRQYHEARYAMHSRSSVCTLTIWGRSRESLPMVLKTRSCSLLTVASKSSPRAAILILLKVNGGPGDSGGRESPEKGLVTLPPRHKPEVPGRVSQNLRSLPGRRLVHVEQPQHTSGGQSVYSERMYGQRNDLRSSRTVYDSYLILHDTRSDLSTD